jgi:hypothetical protein
LGKIFLEIEEIANSDPGPNDYDVTRSGHPLLELKTRAKFIINKWLNLQAESMVSLLESNRNAAKDAIYNSNKFIGDKPYGEKTLQQLIKEFYVATYWTPYQKPSQDQLDFENRRGQYAR